MCNVENSSPEILKTTLEKTIQCWKSIKRFSEQTIHYAKEKLKSNLTLSKKLSVIQINNFILD